MKRSSFLLTLVLALCCLAGCGAPANGGQSDHSPSQSTPTGESGERPQRVLVAYFSATGNTETLARYAAQALGADLYEIEPEIPYTADDLNYSDGGSRASVEMEDAAARPAIAARMPSYRLSLVASSSAFASGEISPQGKVAALSPW